VTGCLAPDGTYWAVQSWQRMLPNFGLLDTLDSAYGPGWKRENSFLAQNPGGNFCYGFFPHGNHPIGKGTRYRATIIGPGVTSDVYWESPAPGEYNRELDVAANAEQKELAGSSKYCRPN
jgi:hypothetical protein